jgi:hypothetical protein
MIELFNKCLGYMFDIEAYQNSYLTVKNIKNHLDTKTEFDELDSIEEKMLKIYELFISESENPQLIKWNPLCRYDRYCRNEEYSPHIKHKDEDELKQLAIELCVGETDVRIGEDYKGFFVDTIDIIWCDYENRRISFYISGRKYNKGGKLGKLRQGASLRLQEENGEIKINTERG